MTDTPILFIIFNRPDTTERVFENIRQAQPKQLFIAADGPRTEKERGLCEQARAETEHIDWNCDVQRDYADTNLGCKERVASAIDSFFGQVEAGIILEDDTVPHPDFFEFCEKMLTIFRDNKDVMMVSGTNKCGKWKAKKQKYHFSQFGDIWGWATWRDSWKKYDKKMRGWKQPGARKKLKDVINDPLRLRVMEKEFERTFNGDLDSWDFQWSFARLTHEGVSVVPAVNLITNIGFDERATHTKKKTNPFAALPTFPLSGPFKQKEVIVDTAYDTAVFRKSYLKTLRQKAHRFTLLLKQFITG